MDKNEIESIVKEWEANLDLNMKEIDENIRKDKASMADQEIQRPKSDSTTNKVLSFNPQAPPFKPPVRQNYFNPGFSTIGSSQVNGPTTWVPQANNRVFLNVPRIPGRVAFHPNYLDQSNFPARNFHELRNHLIYQNTHYSPFVGPYSRGNNAFGANVHPNGFIELKLRENIIILISVDRSIIIENPNSRVTIAVSSDMKVSSLKHPNGIVNQQIGRIDIMAFDGSQKNNYLRYAKMWEKGISLTFEGCQLTYLVDSGGTRTTSDPVAKDLVDKYLQAFTQNVRFGSQFLTEAQVALNNHHAFTQEDGTQVFDILGYRISQTNDGMVRVSRSQNRIKIHTSPTNGSATLTTPNIHCTASMGTSSHLFVRQDERRMHFDGTSFVVRNAGHSAGFEEHNHLRVY